MRLQRLRLRHFRAVEDREVRFREHGVTIIRGDNETGKSSLREAVDLLLKLPHDWKDARLRRVKPVDRDVGPEVELEMTIGPYHFVYRKRWLKNAETVLQIETPAPEHYTGREAHNRVRELVEHHADWTLWQALHADQGVNLAQAQYRASRSLVRALDRIAAAQLSDDAADSLYERVKQEYERYFTAQGRLKKEHAEVRRQAEAADQQAADLGRRLADLEAAVARYELLATELNNLQGQLAEADGRLGELAALSERIRALESRLETQRAQAQLAVQELKAAQQRSEARARLVAEAERRRSEQADLQTTCVAMRERLQTASRARADAATGLAQARQAEEEAVRRRELAAADFEHHRDRLDHQQLVERLAAVREGQQALAEAEAFLSTCRVDDARLAEIERAHLAVEQVRAQLELNKTTVVLEPEGELTLIVDGRTERLAAHEPWQRTFGERTVMELPGVARLTVEPGRGTAALAAQLRATQENLAQRLAEAAASDVEAARELNRRRLAMAAQREAAAKRIRQAQRDLTPQEMERRIDQLALAIDDYAGRRPAEPRLALDLDAARLSKEAAEAVEREAQERRGRCQERLDQAEQELAQTQREAERLTALVEQASAELRASEAELARARDEVGDAELAGLLAEAEQRAQAAQAEEQALQAELETLAPATVRAEERAWREQREALAGRMTELRRERDHLAARLEIEGAQGLHEAAGQAQAEAGRAWSEWQRLDERAEAARLLWQVLHRHREEAHRRYHAPLREMIERLGRPVFGDTFAVELNEQLQIARRTLNGISLPFEDLSTGAREQLCVIERLACAAIVSPDGGAPVILDDALGYADPRRLAALGRVLSLAGRDGQVILLTSNPERFRDVADAAVVELNTS